MRDLTPLENELDNLKRHNSYLAFRMSHAVSSGEIAMLESAMKVNNEGIASISSEMIVEHLKKLCGVCGNEHSYSDAVCEEKHFACGACGEWINESENHNCSEEMN